MPTYTRLTANDAKATQYEASTDDPPRYWNPCRRPTLLQVGIVSFQIR